ncbi:hypothetical protein [Microbacterium hydrocarbonoxydans]|nr:hypothetical protein [Microbacterium hydrocarbonoxydans]
MAALREADADWAAQRAANVADQGIVIEELHEIKASPEADALGKSVSRASRSLGADRPNGSEP